MVIIVKLEEERVWIFTFFISNHLKSAACFFSFLLHVSEILFFVNGSSYVLSAGFVRCLKSLKVIEFRCFRVWKVLEFCLKCLKVIEIHAEQFGNKGQFNVWLKA